MPVFIGLYYTLRSKLREDICPAVQHAFQTTYAAAHHVSAHVAAGQTTYCTSAAYAHAYHGGASFLFINDITNTATGATLIALIVGYVGTQLASTLMMSSPTMDKTQRQLMMLLPLFSVVIIIKFPPGLIVYWIATNACTMLQQWVIKRHLGPMVPAPAPAAAAVAEGNGAVSGGGLGSQPAQTRETRSGQGDRWRGRAPPTAP